jgi:hypothetical protein
VKKGDRLWGGGAMRGDAGWLPALKFDVASILEGRGSREQAVRRAEGKQSAWGGRQSVWGGG